MKNHLLNFIVIYTLISSFSLPISAQNIKDFDKNNDGKLDKSELKTFLLHKISPGFKTLDKDKNGIISQSETEDYIVYNVMDIIEKYGDKEYYTFDEIMDFYPQKSSFNFFGMKLRDSYQEVTFDTEERGFTNSKPATASFSRNILSNQNLWQLKGSLMRPIRLSASANASNKTSFNLSTIGIIPSITFNRVVSPNPKQEVNSLQSRLGLNLEFTGGFFQLQSIKLFATYATDFSLRSKVMATEFEWEPTPTNIAIGVYKPILPNILSFRWKFISHFEYGYVINAGDKTNIKTGDSFLRLGPNVEINLIPDSLNRFELTVKWNYLYGAVGTPQNCRLWNVTATYQIDEVGHYSVQVDYSNGQIPLTVEYVENVMVGIGIKF